MWHRIPMLVNGRADETEREQIEAHLRVCDDCRNEVAAQRQVMDAIARDKRIDSVAGPAFQRLWERISAAEAAEAHAHAHYARTHEGARAASAAATPAAAAIPAAAAPAVASAAPVAPPPSWLARNRSVTRWLAAAVIVEAVGILTLSAALSSRDAAEQPAAEYQTVTSTAAPAAHGIIRAVFSPTLRMSDLQQLLDESHLQIVAGPTEAGVYTLATTSGAQSSAGAAEGARTDVALAELRANPAVRFAEPIGK